MTTIKGFIKDYNGNPLLPITRGELVLDKQGKPAFHSSDFIAQAPSAGFDGLPGLITAAEKALIHTLDGDSESGTISEIYAQLDKLFDIGIKINNNTLSFYDSNTNPTPISFTDGANIIVTNNGNTVTLDLAPKGLTTKVESIVNKVIVDDFGRVTTVEGSNTLDTVIIKNSKVDASITDTSDNLAIANKSYVDNKFNTANSVALGALKFDGVIESSTQLNEIWSSINNKVNYYYKIGFVGSISADRFHDSIAKSVKLGDTLIVYQKNAVIKFVHIPSGDEPITSITVKDSSNNGITNAIGSVEFSFATPFVATSSNDGKVGISLPTLSDNNEAGVGLLSRTDYALFKAYSAKSVTYTPTIKSTDNYAYEIGKINFGDNNIPIYGQNTTYELGLINGSTSGEDASKNPKLVFKPSSGNPSATIQFVGSPGIQIKKENDTIKVTPDITSADETYIKVTEGSIIGVNLGKVNTSGEIENGLIDYQTTVNYVAQVHQTAAHFTEIANTLNDTETSNTYCYGGNNLRNVITVNI